MDEFGFKPEGCQSCRRGRTKKEEALRKGKTWNEVKIWTVLFDGRNVYLS